MCSDFPKKVSFVVIAMMTIVVASSREHVVAEATTPATAPATTPPASAPVLHVAADPNNLPFSNDKLEGFENRIAELIAHDLGARVEYVWWAQRRGFFRDAVKHGEADIVMGVPTADFERVVPSVPYYRSSFVFVTRRDRSIHLTSLDDRALRTLKIGVQLVGATTPPGLALARRGIVDNVTGYTVYTDYREPNPPARILDSLVKGEVDVAIVWGPLAGYFAKHSSVPLDVVPVTPQMEPDGVPLAFDISVGIKRARKDLKPQIDAVLEKRRPEIEKILAEYGVPIVESPAAAAAAAARQSQVTGQ